MNFPCLENQTFSEKTLKGFLLKNVDANVKNNPSIQELNRFLIQRVDTFWDNVVVPLQESGNFDGNKINWYFEIYKEGVDARKLGANKFQFGSVTNEQVYELVQLYKDKTLTEYIELGTCYLANSYSMLTSWVRDQMILIRLEHIYYSENPVDWIKRAEEEEQGVMSKKPDQIDGLMDIITNIGSLMSRKI